MNLIPSGRAAGGPTRDDAGVSLVELLISMILVSVLGTMIVTTFIQGANAAYDSDARTADTQQAKILTENTSRMLRLAVDPDGTGALTPFEVATRTRWSSTQRTATGAVRPVSTPRRRRCGSTEVATSSR